MILGYEKKTRSKGVIWTEEGSAAFYNIIAALLS